MNEGLEITATRPVRDTILRVLVLGSVYAVAIAFVIALSPSAGLISPHPVRDTGNVAATPEPAQR